MTLTEWLDRTLYGADVDALRHAADDNAAAWMDDPDFNDSAAACVRAVRALDADAARFFARHRHIKLLPYDHTHAAYWPGQYC
ncbi:hypothetical protein [Dokdonella sp.]|uniref:hypothetical protein n=1 Tax=Dokdonella sp. TaxID=2291710 RepID=UPI0031BF9C23|nr:hypothetical protein [Dokdonella sp.]